MNKGRTLAYVRKLIRQRIDTAKRAAWEAAEEGDMSLTNYHHGGYGFGLALLADLGEEPPPRESKRRKGSPDGD